MPSLSPPAKQKWGVLQRTNQEQGSPMDDSAAGEKEIVISDLEDMDSAYTRL